MELIPKKSLGQHFLHSPSALAKIIDAARIIPGDKVLEIGPGTGILTAALLKAGARVVAIEKDERAMDVLRAKFAAEIMNGMLDLRQADILEADRAGFGLADREYSLVANIPYYITGAIMSLFLEHEPRPNRMIVLVQKEVADRIVASDGKESILSISVKAFGTPKLIAKVPRGAFVPPPTVDSAILSVENISGDTFKEKGIGIGRFFEIVKAGFAHKRKFVKSNLKDVLDESVLGKIWEQENLSDKVRAEDLDTEKWLKISTSVGI